MAGRRSSDPYEQLLALSECELEHAGRGEFGELAAIAAEREAIIAALPPTSPAEARPTLVRIALANERVSIELQRGREQVLFALRRVVLARRTAQGYRRSFGDAATISHIDASA